MTDTGAHRLVTSIIAQAAKDVKTHNNEDQAIRFLNSSYCKYMVECLGYKHKKLEKINVSEILKNL